MYHRNHAFCCAKAESGAGRVREILSSIPSPCAVMLAVLGLGCTDDLSYLSKGSAAEGTDAAREMILPDAEGNTADAKPATIPGPMPHIPGDAADAEFAGADGSLTDVARDVADAWDAADASGSGGGVNCPDASAELCNGEDENCNGIVDEGCLVGRWLQAEPSTVLGESTGGSAFTETCKDDELVVGFQVRILNLQDITPRLMNISSVCQKYLLSVDSDVAAPYPVKMLGDSRVLNSVGDESPDSKISTAICSDQQVVVKVAAQVGDSNPFKQAIVGLTVSCSAIAVDGMSGNAAKVKRTGSVTSLRVLPINISDPETVNTVDTVAVGLEGMRGVAIDRFTLRVASISLSR